MQLKSLYLKAIFSGIFFLLVGTHVIAQNSFRDFEREKDINKKGEIGLYLWNEYLRNDIDSLKILAVELMLSAAEEKSTFAKTVGNFALGSYLIRNGKIADGIFQLRESEKYFAQKEDYTILSETYNEIGNGYFLAGEYHKAIKSYLESLRYGNLSPDITAAFNAKIGLGKSYCAIGDTAVAILTVEKYKSEAIKLLKFEAAADAYAFLAQIEDDRKNVDLAREYFDKSIVFSAKSKSIVHLSHAYANKAIRDFGLGEMDSSLFYFEKSLALRKQINHWKGIVEGYYNLGYYYFENGDYKMSEEFYNKSVVLARKKNFKGDELDALVDMQPLYKALNNLTELARIEKRIFQLKAEMESDESADQEIIAYAQKVLLEANVEDEAEMTKGKSYLNVWLIGSGLLLLGIFILRRKRLI